MYEVSIFNDGVETLIHSINPNKEAPHLLKIPFKESLSMPEVLSFLIPCQNQGYELIEGLLTYVKVTDTRDNSTIFNGRVIPIRANMTNEGKFYKEVVCEGALAFFNDTQTRRWNLQNKTPTEALTYLLDQHNSKVDDMRKIFLGNVDIYQAITINTNYETTLNTIISKIKNILGGDLRVRETDGLLYLDYLQSIGNDNGVKIQLGYNMKDLIEEYDPTDIVTRLIPLGYGEGINQLGITSVNSGIDYIDNSISMDKYGVIEGVATNKDIQEANTLKIYGSTILELKKQPKLTISSSSLDLSVLTGHESEKYSYGDTLRIVNDVMNIDVFARVIEREFDLLTPWNPQITISTRPISLTDQIIELKQRSLSLENAPQGSTCIFALTKADNADSTHTLMFDLDIPDEAININKVYINLHGRKFRAYETGTASGGNSTQTSESGGGSTTSASGGDTATSEEIGSRYPDSSPMMGDTVDALGVYLQTHTHEISWAHSHNAPSHSHNVEIPSHSHGISYGIFEGTYPKNVKIKVNGANIGVNYGDGTVQIDEYNIDITSRVSIGNNVIEISTDQNGRIDAIVYTQIFIQSK